MEYSFLQNFSSLLEVFTAIYVSMFLDDILVNIWTPHYKQQICQLIKDMKIPAISYFVKKVEENIDSNAKVIGGHMKKKAAFFVVFCMGLLLLAGLEVHSNVLPKYGYIFVVALSLFGLFSFFLGQWIFCKFSRVVAAISLFIAFFFVLYFGGILEWVYEVANLDWIDDKFAICSFLSILSLPILWQLFVIWIYSSLYKGYMQEKIAREAYIYGKAYIAYKLRDIAALPKEYETVARDFVTRRNTDADTSLHSLNDILVCRLEDLCTPPHVLKVFWSWIKYNFRGRHNPEAEYIERNGFDYESMVACDEVEPQPVFTGEGIESDPEQPVSEENQGPIAEEAAQPEGTVSTEDIARLGENTSSSQNGDAQ